VLQSCGEKVEDDAKVEEPAAKNVTVSSIEIKTFVHEIKVQGNVETDQDIMLNAEMGGLITTINVKEGQKVNKGTVIATIDASILASNLVEIQSQMEYAEYMLGKQEELQKQGLGTEFDLETAKNQVKSLQTKFNSLNTQKGKSQIKAPFTGVIDRIFAKKGEMAGPQSPIVRLVNNKKVDIVASISEKYLSKIKMGTPIRVTFPNYGDYSLDLSITNIGNYIEPTNRTFRVLASVEDNTELLPNMLAELHITDFTAENGVVISSQSVLIDQDGVNYIYTVGKDNKVIREDIVVIATYEGETLIEASKKITAATKIIIDGAKGVSPGGKVKINK
jgi:RND family efflux transporter MFP subunit